jgi:hypothetical protein
LPRSFPDAEVAAALGGAPARRERVASGGYGRNTAHWRVELRDGRRAFLKVALDDVSAEWLRQEWAVYSAVTGTFMPELLGWADEGSGTVLAIEDLGDAYWPPPWSAEQVDTVLATLAVVAETPPPAGLPALADLRGRLDGWPDVAADPEPLLATGVCSRTWLEAALPSLLEASAACRLDGSDFLHLDVRSDNLCFADGDLRLVDWNLACVGNGLLDVVAWLPSLRLEGGPEPWELVGDSGGLAALIAGFFASRAGLPPPPTAPTVRAFQRRQAEVALPWAARELGLPAPREKIRP